MLAKINTAIIVLLLVAGVFAFVQLQSSVRALSETTARMQTRLSDAEKESQRVVAYLNTAGVECTWIGHNIFQSGESACDQAQYQFCLASRGEIQEEFYKDEDDGGSCFDTPIAKDYNARLYECESSINEQTEGKFGNQDSPGGPSCVTGAFVESTIHVIQLPVKASVRRVGSYCCKYTEGGEEKPAGKVLG